MSYGQTRKVDPARLRQLKAQGLTNHQIARRLGVTQGAIYHVLRAIEKNEQQQPRRADPC